VLERQVGDGGLHQRAGDCAGPSRTVLSAGRSEAPSRDSRVSRTKSCPRHSLERGARTTSRTG
jgi:hypothetical protein